ncbi:MAG: 1-acyl-sn-glycerol-3-phosphate acyltransferase [Cyclobacteriaceae bacterium]|nr:1-acyl-sn-glycerol-3-phosphate acyltransferase [Cyclobacteriaceae bacterium]
MIQKIIYHSLKNYSRLALWFYFKHWQVNEHAPIPKGAVIFVATHQNAFLDAVVMACSTKRDPWFITRANVFNKPLVKKILTILQMLPVYRFRDGFSTLRKNDVTIDTCVSLLSNGECILIFGEGNHNDRWFLRPLQKGFARIGIAAEEKNNWNLRVNIVPVGIQYDSHTKFRSRVLANFGKPILVSEVCNPLNTNQQNMDALIKRTEDNLKSLILHIPPDEYETKIVTFKKHRSIKPDLVEQLQADQLLVHNDAPIDAAISKKTVVNKWLNPLFVYQFINHLLPFGILNWVLKNKVSDPQFIGSLKFALGMILVPFSYLLQTTTCYLISGSPLITIIYFISLPLSVIVRR